jgi:hypothetical protein
LFGGVAGVLNSQGINILLNIFFGPIVNAARAIAYQLSSAVNQFVINFHMAVRPQITKYYAAAKNGAKRYIDLVAMKINSYLDNFFYLTGQGQSAYNGQSGSYSVGMLGIGYRSSKFVDMLTVGAEILAGAAGGSSLNTEGGLAVQPMAYLGMKLTKAIGLKLGVGRIISVKGALNATVLDFAFCFEYGANRR